MKIAIIGGGASGLTSAISAGKKAQSNKIKAEITVYEAKDRVGKKILATGNGRCNMMNLNESVDYFGDNSFVLSVLKRYDVKSNLLFFSEMGLYTRIDEEGRIYPMSNQASGVLDILRFECERLGIKFSTETKITSIKKTKNGFLLNDSIKADKVILACGSLVQCKDFCGYDLLKSLGHTITKIYPSLTKLILKDKSAVKALKGIRHKVKLTLVLDRKISATESGEILFTDYGLSGIAAMQLSAYIVRHSAKSKTSPIVVADLVPTIDIEFFKQALLKISRHNKTAKSENLLTGFMPKKIGEAVLKQCGISLTQEIGKLSVSDIEKIAYMAKNWNFAIEGVKDFSEAQVASGGALCKEFDAETLESKLIKGLYCCGEVLDVDGLCGGYNLQWAWSSGRLCGESVIDR